MLKQDIRRYAGDLILCGFAGTVLDSELKDFLKQVQPAGLVLFARNVESPAAAGQLCAELKSHRAANPLLLAVDQEGGRVARLGPPLTTWPPMRALGACGAPELAHQVGAALATELRALHIDVNFAPVLDVHTNPDNPIIGNRAISEDPQAAGPLAAAFIHGMQQQGVAACGKHFPGHGDTDLDSHLALPRLDHGLARLRQVEWPPFAAAIGAAVSSIMTAHLMVPQLDAYLPATLSPRILKTYLKKELGFSGIVVGDDTEMKALADHYTPQQIARLGLEAGLDVFLPCHGYGHTIDIYEGIVMAAENNADIQIALGLAGERVRSWRRTWYRAPAASTASLGWETHRQLAGRLREAF
jgi:beta-N-acetylhexosaminidase